MEDSARKQIFPGVLAVPTTTTFLYVLVVFSCVVFLGAICLNLVSIPLGWICHSREYVLAICRDCITWAKETASKRKDDPPEHRDGTILPIHNQGNH